MRGVHNASVLRCSLIVRSQKRIRYTEKLNYWGVVMNLTDATLVLLLAARIHGTDEAVRASAKSVVKKLPRSQRDLIYKVIDSPSPLLLVGFVAENLDD
jgi:hypothetical protein